MNPLKRIYCRTFQTGLKIALPFLPYRKPKIVGSVKALPEAIQKKKCSKVLIITDAGIRKLGLTRRLEKALAGADIPYFIYDGTVANPTTDNVAEAIEIYQNEGCDCIIGFGGGSSWRFRPLPAQEARQRWQQSSRTRRHAINMPSMIFR